MGKNLKGKECGKGICQRKDGLYFARFYAKNGTRQNGYFKTLPEAKKWLADAKYEDTHNLIVTAPDMTVDKWSIIGLIISFVTLRQTRLEIIVSVTKEIFNH